METGINLNLKQGGGGRVNPLGTSSSNESVGVDGSIEEGYGGSGGEENAKNDNSILERNQTASVHTKYLTSQLNCENFCTSIKDLQILPVTGGVTVILYRVETVVDITDLDFSGLEESEIFMNMDNNYTVPNPLPGPGVEVVSVKSKLEGKIGDKSSAKLFELDGEDMNVTTLSLKDDYFKEEDTSNISINADEQVSLLLDSFNAQLDDNIKRSEKLNQLEGDGTNGSSSSSSSSSSKGDGDESNLTTTRVVEKNIVMDDILKILTKDLQMAANHSSRILKNRTGSSSDNMVIPSKFHTVSRRTASNSCSPTPRDPNQKLNNKEKSQSYPTSPHHHNSRKQQQERSFEQYDGVNHSTRNTRQSVHKHVHVRRSFRYRTNSFKQSITSKIAGIPKKIKNIRSAAKNSGKPKSNNAEATSTSYVPLEDFSSKTRSDPPNDNTMNEEQATINNDLDDSPGDNNLSSYSGSSSFTNTTTTSSRKLRHYQIYSVWRRFSQFRGLNDSLVNYYQTNNPQFLTHLPEFPGRAWVWQNHTEKSFLQERKILLEEFMTKLLSVPRFLQIPEVQMFLFKEIYV